MTQILIGILVLITIVVGIYVPVFILGIISIFLQNTFSCTIYSYTHSNIMEQGGYASLILSCIVAVLVGCYGIGDSIL